MRLGSLDGDPGARPAAHVHVGSSAPWEPPTDDGLPRFDGDPPDALGAPGDGPAGERF